MHLLSRYRAKIILIALIIVSVDMTCRGQDRKIRVFVDERMELLTTIEYLGNFYDLTPANTDYKKEVAVYFAPYKKHPVVALVKSMLQSETYNGSAIVWYLYQCTFPALKPEGMIVEDECQIGNYEIHQDTLALFREKLHDFYLKTGFHSFYTAHKILFDSICAPVADYVNQTGIIDTIEQHYGQKKSSYNIVLAPLLYPGGFGIQVHLKTGEEVFGIIGPTADSREIPLFPAKNVFRNIVVHEFSHSFCNGIIHKYFAGLNTDSCLVDTLSIINETVRTDYGSDWETSLDEHLVRANEIVLCRKILGAATSDKIFEHYYFEEKWIFLEGLVPLLENEYLTNRTFYKTEEDIMPKIIDYFDEEQKEFCR